MNGQELLTQKELNTLVNENIAEIGMKVGHLISEGYLLKRSKGLSSSDIAMIIIEWANEFTEKYQAPQSDWEKSIPELGNPLGYLDAINNFTDLKLKNLKWLSDPYINDSARFWNNIEFLVEVEMTVTRTLKVKAKTTELAKVKACEWWNGTTLAGAVNDDDCNGEFNVKHVEPSGGTN